MKSLQFSIAALLEWVTLCGALLALSPLLGILPAMALMLMGMCLLARCGPLALALLAGALLAADATPAPSDALFYIRCPLIILIAFGLCVWSRRRNRLC